jgi:hypothetical protein
MTDGPIHLFFNLTYSNYLVLHRTLMQSMPDEWQQRAVAVFEELDTAFEGQEQAESYIVTPARESEYGDLTAAEQKALGIDYRPADSADPDDCDIYTDADGNEHRSADRVLVPVGADPVPHYNRGRTYMPPTERAGSGDKS